MLGGKREAIAHHCRSREGRRRHDSPRRRIQTAHVAVRISRTGRTGAEVAGQSAQSNRSGRHHRTAFRRPRGTGGGIHRHCPDRRAQRAEFSTAHRRREDRQTGAAQTRPLDANRGVAARRRIRSVQWQFQFDVLRTGHPHVRNLHPQHARPLGHPDH